ncbi:MAG: 4Fe-4S binding protein [Clostridia bacterium]
MAYVIDKEKCTGCGECVEVCPTETIVPDGDKFYIQPDNCIDCGNCEATCPVSAISPE